MRWRPFVRLARIQLIGVPGFVTLPSDMGASTQTYKVHHSVDYYRCSLAAVTEVFFDDMKDVQVEAMLNPPRIVASGVKPLLAISTFAIP